MTRTGRTIAQALTLLLGFGTAAQGLTIYRIGGSTLPPPELPDGADFVQLDWQAAVDSDHGAIDLLHGLEPDALEPDKLDPTVNLAPIFEEIGGSIYSSAYARLRGRVQTRRRPLGRRSRDRESRGRPLGRSPPLPLQGTHLRCSRAPSPSRGS